MDTGPSCTVRKLQGPLNGSDDPMGLRIGLYVVSSVPKQAHGHTISVSNRPAMKPCRICDLSTISP